MSAWPSWQPTPLSPRHRVAVYRTPVSYFAERVRRLQTFSYATLDARFWALRANPATPPPTQAALLEELGHQLARLPALDPDLFVATHPAGDGARGDGARGDGAEDAVLAAMERTLPPGYVAQDGALFRRATLDGTIRALYDALRSLPVVAVGPGWLIELSGRLRLSRFSLVVPPPEPEAARSELLVRLLEGHAAFQGAPVAYLFRAGLLSPWLVLELHRRLRNAFLLDLGPALDVCVPERVLAASWGRIHWRAIASHLGLDGHRARHTRRREAHPPSAPDAAPAAAPARRRDCKALGVERRRPPPFVATPRETAPAQPGAPLERLAEGDLERCLTDVLERGSR